MEINEVFTPRNSEVNANMYVQRPVLEQKLLRALNGGMHSLLFGESGNGKSWLFKHVLVKNKIPFVIANAGNISRFNSVSEEICNAIIESGISIKTGYSEEKKVKISALLAQGEVAHNGHYSIKQDEPLLAAFKYYEELYPEKKHIIVIDNFESIFNSEKLMAELSDIILLLDDSRYAPYHVNFLIVGLPLDIFEYFNKAKNMESVSNRINELPKVQGLSKEQVTDIVKKGFNSLLKYNISPQHIEVIAIEVFNNTMGIAQNVHEFCEKLAYEICDNSNKFEIRLIEKAKFEWLIQGLRQAYTVVESNLNNRNSDFSRSNQVIFIIGWLSSHQFDVTKIENEIKVRYPKTVPPRDKMGIKDILTKLTKSEHPLLSLNSKTNQYSLINPRYAMCIRVVLYERDGKVNKMLFNRY
jgi:Cdc6-like AAA superfamily ATPase